jgi:hypothetical protein
MKMPASKDDKAMGGPQSRRAALSTAGLAAAAAFVAKSKFIGSAWAAGVVTDKASTAKDIKASTAKASTAKDMKASTAKASTAKDMKASTAKASTAKDIKASTAKASTVAGLPADKSEWKDIPVRRLTQKLEESLYRETKWVVFEPNDEPLWAKVRVKVGDYMMSLYRQGAFQGKTPKDAFFVRCDRSTMTQDDINLGIVNILVGFAPLKPAEFEIIKIQQQTLAKK